jgi:membrane associated rhomboid family serine protease
MPTYYHRSTPPMWGSSFASTAVAKLLLANVVVFIVQMVFPPFTGLFALVPRLVVEGMQVWRLATYMFLHGSPTHLLFNMLILWLFGSALESTWGRRHFLRYYLFCGVGAGLVSLLFYSNPVVGASGAIYGLYLAYAMIFPNNLIYLWFVLPIKAKHLVIGLALLQLAYGLSGPSGVAYFAHLGGMAAGLLYFRSDFLRRARIWLGLQGGRRPRASTPPRREEDPERDNIDSILEKISSKGYQNLSDVEKRILENYSRKRSEDSD